MSEVIAFAADRKTARANLMGAWLEGGEVRIYSAPVPADPETEIDTQILLATFALPDPIGLIADGVLTVAAIDPAMIAFDGIAAWARAVDDAGVTIADFGVGTEGSGQSIIVDNLNLITGAIVTLTAFVYAEG